MNTINLDNLVVIQEFEISEFKQHSNSKKFKDIAMR